MQKQLRSLLTKKVLSQMQKMTSLEIYADYNKNGIEYALTCQSVFVQDLNNMCLDAEMVHIYKHFFSMEGPSCEFTGEILVQ